MDRQTLVNYGWIVIAALVIAIMLALATPFGKYVMDGVSSVASGYINASNKAMSEENKDKLVAEWEDKWLSDEEVYAGMIYTSGNYEYCYGYKWDESEKCQKWSSPDGCGCEETCDGWSVRCINNVADPGPILESIKGKPVTNMNATFYKCTNLTTAPEIPESVTDMTKAFSFCTSLTTAPMIPDGVICMLGTFEECTALTTAPAIPESVIDMKWTFGRCRALTSKPTIPSRVLNSERDIFYGCTQFGIPDY